MTAPATPAAHAAAPVKPTEPAQDPFLAKYAKDILGAALDENFNLQPIVPDASAPVVPDSGKTISEIVTENSEKKAAEDAAAKAAEAAKAKVDADAAAAAEAAKKNEPAPAAPAADLVVTPTTSEKVLEIQQKIAAQLEQINAQMNQRPEPKPEPPKPAPAPAAPDAFEASLPEESREVLEVLKWAAEKPENKELATRYTAHLRKLDEFAKTNPEPEDLERFQRDNPSPVSMTQVRKLRDERLVTEAEQRAYDRIKKEQSPDLEKLRQKQRELEIKPLVEAASQNFTDRFKVKREGVTQLEPEIAQAILANPDKAAEEYEIEAPILKRHIQLSTLYLNIANGLIPYDSSNKDHLLLDSFVVNQQQKVLDGPETGKVRNGKTFVTRRQMRELLETSPEKAEKHWAFDDNDIQDALERNAHLMIDVERKKVKRAAQKMGYEPKPAGSNPPVVAKQPETDSPEEAARKAAAAAAAGSPSASAGRVPGAADTRPGTLSNLSGLENLYPGVATGKI